MFERPSGHWDDDHFAVNYDNSVNIRTDTRLFLDLHVPLPLPLLIRLRMHVLICEHLQ
jgi:hypothetical protein